MTTVTEPNVHDIARALLTMAGNLHTYDADEIELLAEAFLPSTPRDQAVRSIKGVQAHLHQSHQYATATPQWVADLLGDDYMPADDVLVDWLRERADVWHGEAETLALTAAVRDREARP